MPKNGTMGMCYIGNPDTGEFYGLVCVNSLVKTTRKAQRKAQENER